MSRPDIEVTVVTEYLPEQSNAGKQQYAFAYHIRIANRGEISAQLLSREWLIVDANEQKQEVQGIGVIGEQPHIPPGQEHQYSSGVVLQTPFGTMEGSYQMVDAEGTAFDAPVPTFLLAVPGALH